MRGNDTTHGKELVEVTAIDGTNVKITLADWAESVIDRALARHKLECPVEKYRDERVQVLSSVDKDIVALDKRILGLELKLKIVHWLIIPFYVGIAGWLVSHFTTIFDVAEKIIP